MAEKQPVSPELQIACAKALDVPVEGVKSIQTDSGGQTHTVLYTQEPTNDPENMLYQATLWTNIEGTLEIVSVQKLCTFEYFAIQAKLLTEAMRPDKPKVEFMPKVGKGWW